MREIILDATSWKTTGDFYSALLPTLGAPEDHGSNINAIMDSMIGGDMNAIEPPYTVIIHHTKHLPTPVIEHIDLATHYLIEARSEFRESEGQDIEVAIERT